MLDPFKKDSTGSSIHLEVMAKIVDLILANNYLREAYEKYAGKWFSIESYKVLTPENKEWLEDEKDRCMNSFIYEYELAAAYYPIQAIIDNFKSAFSKQEILYLKKIGKGTLYGVFEVECVEKGIGFIGRDASTGKRYKIGTVNASFKLKPGMLHFGRICQIRDYECVMLYNDGTITKHAHAKAYGNFFAKFYKKFGSGQVSSWFTHEYISRKEDDDEAAMVKSMKLVKKVTRKN